ncbi:neuraminidase-like domain-containing protein [Actinopolymorpha sp. B17G11]|uniref:neuraminidase-like domain-containing protein n=1 Tax=Actinopolymorpha sp. B17G11 TaxID=3160861 RepID=UPI0032E41088
MATVTGVVLDFNGVARSGLRVVAFDRDFDGLTFLASSVSGVDGRYLLEYSPAGEDDRKPVDLELQVFDDRAGDAPVATTATRFDAPEELAINIGVDASKLSRVPELSRLSEAVRPVLRDRALSDLDAEAVVYLGKRVGWDPRLVAMAAQADAVERETDLPASATYAMLRAGLPSESDQLARVADDVVVRAFEIARAAGVLDLDDATIARALKIHRRRAERQLATVPARGAESSLGDMLAIRLDAEQQRRFIRAYRAHQGSEDADSLWEALREDGFDERVIDDLKTDATLGRITGQNAPVVWRVLQQGVERASDLATLGFIDPAAWDELVGDDVPAAIARETYVAALAAQVELRFPTHVAASLATRDELGLGQAGAEAAEFLAASAEIHTIGREPVKHWEGFADLGDEARDGVLRLERIYQITPSHTATLALSKAGLGSARDVVALTREGFIATHGADLGGAEAAERVYRRAADVHGAALNIAVGYLAHRTTPPIYAISGKTRSNAVALGAGGGPGMTSTELGPTDVPDDTPAATLEALFGSFEYCDCSHCRSIFSPAAYFVELLELLDASDSPHTGAKPISVLFARRPDLQHLLLSCENTNVVLPYIDIVNEILEHAVIEGDLATYTGFDTPPDAVSADLLADPQFVAAAAYTTTAGAVFPYVLPFDLPLATLRQLLQAWDTTLPDALAVMGDVAGSRRERLGLNSGELAALTDVQDHTLAEHVGEPATSDVHAINAAIGSARAFTRRLGLDYEELTALLRTQTINPAVTVLPAFESTGLGFDDLRSFLNGTMSAADITAALPAGFDPTPFGCDVPAWLLVNGPSLLRLVVLSGPDEAAFGDLRLRHTDPALSSGVDELTWHQLHRFVRLRTRRDADIAELDRLLTTHFGVPPGRITLANLDDAWTRALRAIAALDELIAREDVSSRARKDWLALWAERTSGTPPKEDPAAIPTDLRRERLARLLRAGTVDLATLIDLSGIDPFTDDLDIDAPSLHRFVALWQLFKAARLKQVDLDYLLRHHDQTGSLAPTEATARADVKAVRDALTAVDADLAVAVAGTDSASAVARVAQVYDQETADRFFALLGGAVRYETPFVSPVDLLPSKLLVPAPDLAIDSFDNTLVHTGILSSSAAMAVKTAAAGLTVADIDDAEAVPDAAALATFVTGLGTAVDALAADGQADLDALAADAPELAAALPAAAEPADRPAVVIGAILPVLRAVLRAAAIRATLARIAPATPEVIDALTGDAAVLPSSADATAPVLDDLLALDEALLIDADGTHELLLDPPVGPPLQLWVVAPPGATVALAIGPEADSADPPTQVIAATAVGAAGEVKAPAAIALTPGRLVPASLTVSGLPADGTVWLAWRTRQSAREAVPRARVTTVAAYDRARPAMLRIAKAAALARLLSLTPAEIARLGGVDPSTTGVFAQLATDTAVAASVVHDQLARVRALAWFAGVRAANEPDPDVLVGLLADPDRTTPQGTPALAALFGWTAADLSAALNAGGLTQADLGELAALERATALLELVATTLQPGDDLFGWITASPTAALVALVRETLRARLDVFSWRETLSSVNAALREQRRDALVAYLLHHDPPTPDVQTPDQLYEHLLVDVQMGECMETSRIRLALSSVQLFITRCLLDLEIGVEAASVDAAQWAWMQRYRVWEANRKVFVYPENWLEPELRPDKSPFFRELEGDLLKADITDELAEDAYLSYLKKLDDVARLEIAGAWLDAKAPGDPGDDVLYVVGHTNGVTRQYYLRRREGTYWTPWEKISLPISGDIVFPVVWKKQLYVFWVQAQPKPDSANESARDTTPSDLGNAGWGESATVGAEISFGWGEYYRGKWTSPKSSELSNPIRLTGLSEFDARKLVVNPRTHKPAGVSERLILEVIYTENEQNFRLTLTSKHRPPTVEEVVGPDFMDNPLNHFKPINITGGSTDRYVDNAFWRPDARTLETVVDQPPASDVPLRSQTVFTKGGSTLPGFTVRPLMHPVADGYEVPFFYGDEHATFWVDVDAKAVRETRYYVDPGDLRFEVSILWAEKVPDWGGPVIDIGNTVLPEVNPVFDPVPFKDLQHFAIDHGPKRIALRTPAQQTFSYRGVEVGADGIVASVQRG